LEVELKVYHLLQKAKHSNLHELKVIWVKLMMMTGDDITADESDYIVQTMIYINNYISEWEI
jgi:hypothetical protein